MRNRLIILGMLLLLERGIALVIRWFEVLPVVVVLHFVVVLAMVFTGLGWGSGWGWGARGWRVGLAVLLALLSGAWVSAHIGGPEACQGFPLCNGALLPNGGGLVLANWSHRIISYMALGVVVFYTVREYWLKRRTKIRICALAAAVIVVMQTGIGAGMVLRQLPRWVVGIHLAVGVALWAAVILWFKLSRTHYSS